MSVVSLAVQKPDDPDQDLIVSLQSLLEQAKSGRLQGLGFAAIYSNGNYQTGWDGSATALTMCGAIGMLQHEFVAALEAVPAETNET